MDKNKRKRNLRRRRHKRVRKTVEGSPDRPRLAVFRSNKHIYCQVIDDWNGHTLTSASSVCPELSDELEHGGNIEAAKRVGEVIGEKCLEQGIDKVVFDRGGYKFHGRVKALALAAREKFEEAGAEGF